MFLEKESVSVRKCKFWFGIFGGETLACLVLLRGVHNSCNW